MNGTAIERGKFIRKRKDPKELAYFFENQEMVANLFGRFRMEYVCDSKGIPFQAEKEWIIPGSRGQIWEYGIGKIGFTVSGDSGKKVSNIERETKNFAKVTQRGDCEANFVCDFSLQNIQFLHSILKLRIRRKSFACP